MSEIGRGVEWVVIRTSSNYYYECYVVGGEGGAGGIDETQLQTAVKKKKKPPTFSIFRTGCRTRQTDTSYWRMIWSISGACRAKGSRKSTGAADGVCRAASSPRRSSGGVSMQVMRQFRPASRQLLKK